MSMILWVRTGQLQLKEKESSMATSYGIEKEGQ